MQLKASFHCFFRVMCVIYFCIVISIIQVNFLCTVVSSSILVSENKGKTAHIGNGNFHSIRQGATAAFVNYNSTLLEATEPSCNIRSFFVQLSICFLVTLKFRLITLRTEDGCVRPRCDAMLCQDKEPKKCY
jgi:hypothetical protein